MQHGSLQNLLAGDSAPAPVVGMGATKVGWTDRHAATIVAVSADGRTVRIQEDRATRTDTNGMSEVQTYEFAPNPSAEIEVYTLRKNGRWVKQGEPMKNGARITIGHRSEYYDYSF